MMIKKLQSNRTKMMFNKYVFHFGSTVAQNFAPSCFLFNCIQRMISFCVLAFRISTDFLWAGSGILCPALKIR